MKDKVKTVDIILEMVALNKDFNDKQWVAGLVAVATTMLGRMGIVHEQAKKIINEMVMSALDPNYKGPIKHP